MKMYELNWHNDKYGELTHFTVTSINVIRRGILEGCTGVSITAIDSTGRKFLGSPEDYYDTEELAWADAKAELQQAITDKVATIAHDKGLLNRWRELQDKMDGKVLMPESEVEAVVIEGGMSYVAVNIEGGFKAGGHTIRVLPPAGHGLDSLAVDRSDGDGWYPVSL